MTRFIIVNPQQRSVAAMTFDSLREAKVAAGLDPDATDHGSIQIGSKGLYGLGYCVYEYSLFVPVERQHYFSLFRLLIGGPAVFYGYDEAGETIDLRKSEFPDVRFYLGINDIEAAIERGEVQRPFMAANGVTMWEWPSPAPAGFVNDG